MDSDYLPSKKFVKIVGAILIIIAIIIIVKNTSPSIKSIFDDIFSREVQVSPEHVEAYQAYRELDTDGDGLYDWEEALFGTSPTMIDTNADGTSDYEEFYSQRSSLVFDESTWQEGEVATGEDAPLTYTDAIARDIYTSLSIAKQQSGGVISEEDKEKLATITANSFKEFDYVLYTSADFTISSDANALSKFLTDFANIQVGSPINSEDIKVILLSINNETEIPADVLGRVAQYQSYIQKHNKFPIPQKIQKEYIDYVNSLSKMLTATRYLSESNTDPARALGAYYEIENSIDGFSRTLFSLQKALQ